MENKKQVAILGSTGSIGVQALEIIEKHDASFGVYAISCNRDAKALLAQAHKFKPAVAVIFDEEIWKAHRHEFPTVTKVLCGMEGLLEIATADCVDIVLTSVVGNIGLRPTVEAVKKGKRIALANKETLVTSGEMIMAMAKEYGASIFPVDSEHSAIFQCLQGNSMKAVDKLILTASGGPFKGKTRSELLHVKAEQALKHPNWTMGRKITIDSATLMNKGLEVIEARWLFDIEADRIDVVVHPQSIVHSMVQYKDSSVMAQMGLPDMKLPILYAMTYPERVQTDLPRLDFATASTLTFEKPDLETFPCLQLAYEAIKVGGTMPTVLNAANEILVEKYLKNEIGFYDLPETIETLMASHRIIANPNLEDILAVDGEIRRLLKG